MKKWMKKKFLFSMLCALMMCLVACDRQGGEVLDGMGNEKDHQATVTSLPATDITSSSAVLNGSVSFDRLAYSSVEVGILFYTKKSYITAHAGQKLVCDSQKPGDFFFKMNGLSSKTTYYYQTYLILNRSEIIYAEPTQFVTMSNDKENGHDYIDLGLSVKWATVNMGTAELAGYGYYYAWGETSAKSEYSWSTYKWCNGTNKSMKKYCTSSSYGFVDNDTILYPSDDAAHIYWAGKWRIPTIAEWDELFSQCTWGLVGQGDDYAYKVIGPNGNTILLPVAGYRLGSEVQEAGVSGHYLSSSLYTNQPNCAWSIYLDSNGIKKGYHGRNLGFSIRPVCP